ncbi:unnamed protein product, partial [Dovyalis caffra]
FPDGILPHIMSFLPNKDVLRTSVLSKRWKLLLDSYPNLDFICDGFVGSEGHNYWEPKRHAKKFLEILEKFIYFVDASIFSFSRRN